jgi:hypothetical protein
VVDKVVGSERYGKLGGSVRSLGGWRVWEIHFK